MMRCALLVVAAALLVAANASKDDADKTDAKLLEGNWVLASGVDNGKKVAAKTLEGARLSIKGDSHTVEVSGKTYKGTHKLDPAKRPRTIDITDTEGPFKDMTVLGIYEVKKDEFRICYALPGKDRPREFSAKAGSGHHFHIWKRAKK
jgi:uncharacterized protein (TIGR03067 family)